MTATPTKKQRPWRESDEVAAAIGARIRDAREAASLSQREVVDGTGYSGAYLSRVERGQRIPSVRFMRALALRLNTSVAYLETGDDMVDVRIYRDELPAVARALRMRETRLLSGVRL